MCNFKAWGKIFALMLILFLLSGCGGGGSSDSNKNTLPTPTPTPYPEVDDNPDTYDISKILVGTWYGMSGNGTATGAGGNYNLALKTLRGRFEDVDIGEDVGTAKLTGFQVWEARSTSGGYSGTIRLESNRDDMNLIRIGSNKWRCEYPNGTILTIHMTGEKTGEATQEGTVLIHGYAYEYSVNMGLRK